MDQTNITDFDPATGRTTTTLVDDHDRGACHFYDLCAEGEGMPEEPTLPNSVTATVTQVQPDPYFSVTFSKVGGVTGLWAGFPVRETVGPFKVNGTDIGPYMFRGDSLYPTPPTGEWATDYMSRLYCRLSNLDGEDNTAFFNALLAAGEPVTIEWEPR